MHRTQSVQASLPWRDDTGALSCFVTITVSMDINTPFQSQVWARGLGQGFRIYKKLIKQIILNLYQVTHSNDSVLYPSFLSLTSPGLSPIGMDVDFATPEG